jgi:Putative prokaryotic signal transducing protein
MDAFVVLQEFGSRMEAEIVKELLVSNDIEALVVSDDCGAVDPALQFGRGVRLLVLATDASEAQMLLAALPIDTEEHEPTHDE